jgi:hypothetical protein
VTLDQFLKHPDTVGLLKAVSQSPGDPLPRHMLADHAELHGMHGVAAGQRWAAKHGKAPRAVSETPAEGGGTHHQSGGWALGHFDGEPNNNVLPEAFHGHWNASDWPSTASRHLFTMGSFNRVDHPEYGQHEKHYLQRSHEMQWGDDGEPLVVK